MKELVGDDVFRSAREACEEPYFTLGRLQRTPNKPCGRTVALCIVPQKTT